MLKICGIGGFVFAAIAFIAWIISWLTIAIAPDSLIVSRVFASIKAGAQNVLVPPPPKNRRRQSSRRLPK